MEIRSIISSLLSC
ncbi:hypothetical protein F383_14483 [Gossypium arboreum]|uniref:Uncharacterized protein n=1 Tax=Gossypium arboreum TaxID=29729 RepID=A0A0B0MCU8_GOSAR|nr:hypothetical protein F383_14483 [Gossypium arboreum]